MEHLLASMKIIGDDKIQRTQLTHRIALVESFSIQKGMSVIEVGCGQGDTTVVLADAVGETGHVLAIDIAPPHYGAPVTIGEATAAIAASSLGKQVEFMLETELLDVPEKHYDAAVLSHCSWYFRSPEQLFAYLKKLRKMADRIYVAEWEIAFTQMPQRSHFAATAILALYSEFVENDGNIQYVFSSVQLQKLLEAADWTIKETGAVDAYYLQDGAWEVDYAKSIRHEFTKAPPRIQALAGSFYSLLETADIASLDSFVICAE